MYGAYARKTVWDWEFVKEPTNKLKGSNLIGLLNKGKCAWLSVGLSNRQSQANGLWTEK